MPLNAHPRRRTPVAATTALAFLAFATPALLAQEPAPSTPPEPVHLLSDPAAPPADYTGHPKQASAGGSEIKTPPRAGIIPGGPVDILDGAAKSIEKWTAENLRTDVGFRTSWGFQQATGGPGERTAASQDYRMYGTFHAFNWEEDKKGYAGNFYFRAEYREKMFTEIAPYALNTQIGTVFTTTYGQDEHDLAIVQGYYEQFLADGDFRLRVGKLDPDDYFNLGRWADDYRYFDNTLFSAFPASNHPSGGLGFNAQWYVNPEWTLTGGMTDVQGRKTEAGFNTIDECRFIYGGDVTYSPTIAGWGKGNYRFGYEYRDEVPDLNKPSDTSGYFNIDQEIAKDVAPFLRVGWGTGRSTDVTLAMSIGIAAENCFDRKGDACGIGIGFDQINDPTPEQRDIEYAMEAFYRFQMTRSMQLTIGGQWVHDPANDLDHDNIGIFEMRLVIDY